MGSDARLYLFDGNSFQNQVAPGFHKLLRGQLLPHWLVYLVDHSDIGTLGELVEGFRRNPVNLGEHCSYLTGDLACVDPGRFNPGLGLKPRRVSYLQYNNDGARRCAQSDCLARHACPFYIDNSRESAESLNFLFIDAIAWLCDGDGVFVGRSASPASYEALLGALGVAEDHPLRELLDRLGTRGFIFGYGWANGDGVHGWLDGEECGQLAEYLWPLDLPRYPATPENLETWQPGRQRDSEHDWDKLVLAYIRAMAEYAAGKDFGIVWMNDVSLDVRDREGPFRQWMKTH